MGLSKDTIVAAALELLDREGLEGLTLRKLAKDMGVVPSAMYWHIDSRRTLIDHMAEAMLQTRFANLQPCAANESWQDWLVATMKDLRAVMLSRRDGGRVVAGARLKPAVTLAHLSETCIASLLNAGLEIDRAHLVTMTAQHYTFGHVIEEQDSPSLEQLAKPAVQEILTDFRKQFPLLMSGVQRAIDRKITPDAVFEAALRLIVR